MISKQRKVIAQQLVNSSLRPGWNGLARSGGRGDVEPDLASPRGSALASCGASSAISLNRWR
ncbi:hypothetical protein M8494_04915 [Serratia ureilytica]